MEYLREGMMQRMKKYANEMGSLRDRMSQTMNKYANEMPPIRE